ncbi:DUF7527 domain-containing protein [Halorientalis pallida]|uniref:DUF7527 domain-containing protein n=1 Tax=Halorientalis pallida TaxID=2479928 RepID=A0A498KWA2_9EURY|nr:hypothetical protein [Halorientalis pallida]RXK49519.1 hypothetical protein EAF64_11480 [Halorientalis pallida]
MTTRAVEQVDDWDSRPFSGGYRGLHDLADDDFSGIVAAGPTRLCMTSGRVIGILDGTIEDFEDAEGTAYEAPSPALPLLSVMQDRSDEVRAQYYTEETSVDEVDRTLTQGNFTGYVELSENVLSGDYYLVYHQGRSMSVAWVGASEKLLTDDEAFDQANGEVGIYEVRPVDIEVIELPEATAPASEETTPDPDAGAAAATTAEPDTESGTAGTETTSEETTDDDVSEADAGTAGDDAGGTESDEPAADEPEPARAATETSAETDTAARSASESPDEPTETHDRGSDGTAGGMAGTSARDERTRDEPDRRESSSSRRDTERADTAGTDGQGERTDRGASSRSSETQPRQQRSDPEEPTAMDTQRETGSRGAGGPRSGTADSGRSRGKGQQSTTGSVGELETRSIPSLDPDRTSEPEDGNGSQGPTSGNGPTAAAGAGGRSEPDPGPAGNPGSEPRRGSGPTSRGADAARHHGTPQRDPERVQSERPPAEGQQGEPRREPADAEPEPDTESGPTPDEIEELEDELEAREAEIEDLEATLETVEDERDELQAERDELRERVERLERRIDELRTEEGGESVADRERLSPAEAIEGTNLFVRYASKGDATLEAAHAGNAEAGAVNDNMQIQYHTQFEAEDVAVDGEPFAAYLTDTIQYSFVEWVVRVLPYEIRDTGHQEALGPLYGALPKIDRAELNGAVTVQYQESGEEHRSQERFDVVLRDRMGNPLIVANMNESRQPASQSMMEGLITAAQRVGESKESLAGAFLVTSSFFEPEAMEAASDATGSGLLSRDKRESFVKLSRKDGFHLCLVEAREENFNLSVPEI